MLLSPYQDYPYLISVLYMSECLFEMRDCSDRVPRSSVFNGSPPHNGGKVDVELIQNWKVEMCSRLQTVSTEGKQMHRYVKYTSCLLASGGFWTDVIFSSNQTVSQRDRSLLRFLMQSTYVSDHVFTQKAFSKYAVFFLSCYCFCPNTLGTDSFNHSEALVPRQNSPYGFR